MEIKSMKIEVKPLNKCMDSTLVSVRVWTTNNVMYREQTIPNDHFFSLFELVLETSKDLIKQKLEEDKEKGYGDEFGTYNI